MVDPKEYQRRLQNIIQQAKGGNTDAQYALAVITSRQNIENSLGWMQKAIDGGHAGAVYTLGAWHIQGTLIDQDFDKGRALLGKASAMNFDDADMMLAALNANGVGVTRDWQAGLAIVIKKAREGSARALCQLAFLCFMKSDAGEVGETLLQAAAERFDMLALFAYAKRVLDKKDTGPEAEKAKMFMAVAAQRGKHPGALIFPGVEGFSVPEVLPEPTFEPADLDWALIESYFPTPPLPENLSSNMLRESPHIEVFPGFFTFEETDYLIGMSVRHLNPSQVVDPITGKFIQDEYRSSSDMRFWPTLQDLVVYSILERISVASGEPIKNQEMLGILKYEPGQEYKPHGDFLTPDFSGKNPEVERSGQRKKTFLVNLNEEFTGGETEFVNIGLKTRGKKGDGLMFINVTEANEPNTLTIHAGRPIIEGIKWLSTMWIREKEYKSHD
ncbi:MAG: 2OG-Fe(II) oxygenase [Sphingomonadales bacterium]